MRRCTLWCSIVKPKTHLVNTTKKKPSIKLNLLPQTITSLNRPVYLFPPLLLPECCVCRWEQRCERSLLLHCAVMPHQTSTKPCGPSRRHSWVSGHDRSLNDRITPRDCICLCRPLSNLCLLASVCLSASACLDPTVLSSVSQWC